MLKQLKRTVLRTIKQLGGFNVLRDSSWRRRRLLIIGYHGVSIDDEHKWDPSFYVTAATLDQRFRVLRDGGYTVLPLTEAVDRLRTDTLPPRSVVLTFDDGMADFAINAFPLLQRYGFPATVYLTTYYATDNRPVFGMFCSYLLWKSPRESVRSGEVLPDAADAIWDLRVPAGRQAALQAIQRHAVSERLSAARKDELARHIAGVLQVDYAQLAAKRIVRLMTPEEITRLSAAGIDFQLHTHRHRTPVERGAFAREIEDNRRCLIEMTGTTADHFCYPSGVYAPEFFPWLRELGVRSATTCDTGIASPDTNPLLLPRLIDTSNLSPVEFESWMAGVGALLPIRAHSPTH
jgi:peptidoglycan/xylan/chitin deacetylase (PgdA/CDA1 family)